MPCVGAGLSGEVRCNDESRIDIQSADASYLCGRSSVRGVVMTASSLRPGDATRIPKGNVNFTLSPDRLPVAEVSPGARLCVETELNLGDVLHRVGDVLEPEMINPPFINGATGPIYVRGATTGHVLTCDIEAMELIPPGVTAIPPKVWPFIDRLSTSGGEVHSRVVDVREGEVIWDAQLRIPIRPMVGVIGTAPLLEAVSTMDCGRHGGNMDVQELGPGCRIYLPVAVDGALLYIGDCHAIQGDGELAGVGAIEIRTNTSVRVDLAERAERMTWPRFETSEHIGTIASARPLEDAFRLAVEELAYWMADDYAIPLPDAVLLLAQVAEARCTQLVNPKYTYVCKVAKRYLGEPVRAAT
jgi:amidase